jgi:hypothetical protein
METTQYATRIAETGKISGFPWIWRVATQPSVPVQEWPFSGRKLVGHRVNVKKGRPRLFFARKQSK